MAETEAGGPNRPLLRRLLRYREWLVGGRGFTARDAMEELEVCERTVYRDIAYVRTLGWDVEFCRSQRRWVLAGEAAPLPLVSLREPEVMALLMAEAALGSCEVAGYAAALRSALQKLTPLLDTPLISELARGPVPRFLAPPARPATRRQFEQLLAACQRSRRLEISYQSRERDAVERREVQAYRLVLCAGDAYLVAFDVGRGGYRTFALGERMHEIRETGETFTPDAGFDLERYLKDGLGVFCGGTVEEIVLRFRPTVDPDLRERVWHPSEVKQELPDGGLLLTMRVAIDLGVLRFVLQYGAEVEVLAPDALRREIAATHRRALAAYG